VAARGRQTLTTRLILSLPFGAQALSTACGPDIPPDGDEATDDVRRARRFVGPPDAKLSRQGAVIRATLERHTPRLRSGATAHDRTGERSDRELAAAGRVARDRQLLMTKTLTAVALSQSTQAVIIR
jgi:hypothetical protein